MVTGDNWNKGCSFYENCRSDAMFMINTPTKVPGVAQTHKLCTHHLNEFVPALDRLGVPFKVRSLNESFDDD